MMIFAKRWSQRGNPDFERQSGSQGLVKPVWRPRQALALRSHSRPWTLSWEDSHLWGRCQWWSRLLLCWGLRRERWMQWWVEEENGEELGGIVFGTTKICQEALRVERQTNKHVISIKPWVCYWWLFPDSASNTATQRFNSGVSELSLLFLWEREWGKLTVKVSANLPMWTWEGLWSCPPWASVFFSAIKQAS